MPRKNKKSSHSRRKRPEHMSVFGTHNSPTDFQQDTFFFPMNIQYQYNPQPTQSHLLFHNPNNLMANLYSTSAAGPTQYTQYIYQIPPPQIILSPTNYEFHYNQNPLNNPYRTVFHEQQTILTDTGANYFQQNFMPNILRNLTPNCNYSSSHDEVERILNTDQLSYGSLAKSDEKNDESEDTSQAVKKYRSEHGYIVEEPPSDSDDNNEPKTITKV